MAQTRYVVSMDRLKKVAEDARALAEERFGKGVVQEIRVADYVDETGEKAYRILVVVNKFDPSVLTTEARSAVAVSLIRKLHSEGDERFAFLSYVPRDELAELIDDRF